MDIISRKTAKAAGLKYYFTGKPCKRGHIDKRFVSSFWCMQCAREKALAIYHSMDDASKERLLHRNNARNKQWRRENAAYVRERSVDYRRAFKEHDPDYFKRYYAENKERRKRESQEWYHSNPEYHAQRQKAYNAKQRAENAEHYLAIKRKHANTRRARKNEVFVEVIDPLVVFDRDGGICGICLKPVDRKSPWEVDHIVPISKGGAHSYANVQLSHRRCNRKKHAKVLTGRDEWSAPP